MLGLALTMAACAVLASEPAPEPLSLRGYAYATAGDGHGKRPVRQDTTGYGAGVSATYSLGLLSLHGQFETTDERTVNTRYLFADVGNGDHGLRAGRVQHLLGFYNQRRNVPGASDWITPPPAIYRESFRDLAASGEGVQAYATTDMAGWELRGQVTDARANLSHNADLVAGQIGDAAFGEFTTPSRAQGANLTLTSPARELQLRYDYTFLDFNFKSRLPRYVLPSGRIQTAIHVLGARWYVADALDVTVEGITAGQEDTLRDALYKGTANAKGPGGLVLSARWRPAPQWDVHAYTDRWCIGLDDCNGARQSAATRGRVPAHAFYARSAGLFVRKRLDGGWFAAAQVVRGQGTEAHFASDPDKRRDWRTVAVSVGRNW